MREKYQTTVRAIIGSREGGLFVIVKNLRSMLSEKQILNRIPIARSTLQNWEKEGLFPKSVQIGPNRKAWFEDEVAAWQKQCE